MSSKTIKSNTPTSVNNIVGGRDTRSSRRVGNNNNNTVASTDSIVTTVTTMTTTTTTTSSIALPTTVSEFNQCNNRDVITMPTSVLSLPIISHTVVSSSAINNSTSSLNTDSSSSNNKNLNADLLNSSLLNSLNEKITKMGIETQKQIADLHSLIMQLMENYNKIRNEFTQRTIQMEKYIDSIERKLLVDEIIIDGIPVCENNSLSEIFDKFCDNINFSKPAVNSIYRIKSRNGVASGTVLVKFQFAVDKFKLLKATRSYIKTSKRRLQLTDFGINSTQEVFVHERLTKKNYIIFRQALKYKKLKKISRVFVVSGAVHIVKSEGSIPVKIFDQTDLAVIIENKN